MCPDRIGNTQNPIIPDGWRDGEVAIIGLGTTGAAVAQVLANAGISIYASDLGRGNTVRETAARFHGDNVSVEFGKHDLGRIARSTAVVVSPGVPPNAPPVRAALESGRAVWSEIDLACLSLGKRRVIAVTGTNGKTTTTAIIDHILREAGVASVAAGNIGTPLITAVQNRRTDWFVVELSSFQLHYSERLTPAVGVLTNLAPDHMDWYNSADDYYADKKRMFLNARPDSFWVVGADQTLVTEMVEDVEGQVRRFSVHAESDAWFDRVHNTLECVGEKIIDRAEYSLLGDHNVANALAAILVAKQVGLETDAIRSGLQTMTALPHRLEPVRHHAQVRWVNDSKATNVASALAAIRSIDGPLVLILGGRGKGEHFGPLADAMSGRGHLVYAYGEAAPDIVKAFGSQVVKRVERIDDAVADAHRIARPGDTVLLSPACTSFDQYDNYMHRGDAFRTLVQQL